MSRFSHAVLIAGTLTTLLLFASTAQAKDPLEGTWQLNVEKSTFKGAPGPKGQMRTYTHSGGLEKMTARGISADRKPALVHYEARYDGMDYDITGSVGGDKISLRRIDALTTESTQKRDGKPVIVATRKVSSDGRVLVVSSTGTLPDGQIIDSSLIFEKH